MHAPNQRVRHRGPALFLVSIALSTCASDDPRGTLSNPTSLISLPHMRRRASIKLLLTSTRNCKVSSIILAEHRIIVVIVPQVKRHYLIVWDGYPKDDAASEDVLLQQSGKDTTDVLIMVSLERLLR